MFQAKFNRGCTYLSSLLLITSFLITPTDASEKIKDQKQAKKIAQQSVEKPQAKLTLSDDGLSDEVKTKAALISVLKDITKALNESSDYTNMSNAKDKQVVKIVLDVLNSALTKSPLPANRIINTSQRSLADNAMTAEVFESGEIVTPNCRAAVQAVWAKKTDGLINIAVVGNSSEIVDGGKIGEFVFIALGKSAVESGFDIQSQTSVNYWLGKLTSFSLDSASNQLAQKPTEEPSVDITTTTSTVTTPVEEEKPPRKSYLLKAPTIKRTESKQVEVTKVEAKSVEKLEEKISSEPKIEKVEASKEDAKEVVVVEKPAAKPSIKEEIVVQVKAADTQIIAPDKAQAGQIVTVSVVNGQFAKEAQAEVLFNGVALKTDENGKAQFKVPEDSTPGPTLKIKLAGRADGEKTVQIVQPLAMPNEPQAPHIDRVTAEVSKFDTINIQGHNFNGDAQLNRVIIDGKWDAEVLAASPLAMKVLVPDAVPAGPHSACVASAGLRSNPIAFSLIALEVEPNAKPGQAPTRLIVRALGTAKPIGVHLKNNTPNIITIVKGNDIRIKTAGGKDNFTAVAVRLKQAGNYNIQASIE